MNKELEHNFVTQLEQNQNIVHKICRLYTNDSDGHNDLFQEITIQLWRAYPKFRGDSKFSTWMYRVALNTALTEKRRNKTKVSISFLGSLKDDKAQESIVDAHEENLNLLFSAISKLTEVEKAVVMLYLDDKSYEDMEDVLGINQGTLRVKMNRIKEKLRQITKV